MLCSTEYRQKFLEAHKAIKEQPRLSDHPLNLDYKAEIEKAWKAKFPRKRKIPDLSKMYEELGYDGEAILNKYIPLRDAVLVERQRVRDELDSICTKSAEYAALHSTPEENVFRRHWLSSYSSQTNPSLYARTMAEFGVIHLKQFDIKARVVMEEGGMSYAVMANADSDSLLIASWRKEPSIKMFYNLCKETGANIRVYYPGLSWDLYP